MSWQNDSDPETEADVKDDEWETEEDHGIIAVGGELTIERLRSAYANGVFPWPHGDLPMLWFCPARRAILRFSELHIPESLAKARRRSGLTFTIDRDFAQVISDCQRIKRPDQDGTWITPEMHAAYVALHKAGHAHSVEAWDTNSHLVGGLYGVDGGGVFSGESMFHLVPNASKLALLFLIDHLKSRGLKFMDIQQLTPHMRRLGAREIPRSEFLALWMRTRERQLSLFGG